VYMCVYVKLDACIYMYVAAFLCVCEYVCVSDQLQGIEWNTSHPIIPHLRRR